MSGGGIDIVAYRQLFKDMASYGLVVVAPGGCGAITGKACNDPVNSPYTDCAGLHIQPLPDVCGIGDRRTHRNYPQE